LIDFFGSKMRQNNELKRFGISTKNRNALTRMTYGRAYRRGPYCSAAPWDLRLTPPAGMRVTLHSRAVSGDKHEGNLAIHSHTDSALTF